MFEANDKNTTTNLHCTKQSGDMAAAPIIGDPDSQTDPYRYGSLPFHTFFEKDMRVSD